MRRAAANALEGPAAVRRRRYGTTAESDSGSDSGGEGPASARGTVAEEVRAVKLAGAKRLSEANQYSRHLNRELQSARRALEDDAKALASLETEIRALAAMGTALKASLESAALAAGEGEATADAGTPAALDHMSTRLLSVADRLDKRLEGAEAMLPRPVIVQYEGWGTEVRVMGSFDSWTHGELMSNPEQDAADIKCLFTCELMLRPGTYEVKFRVDGEWRVADDMPMHGEGENTNNLLIH
eukprot:PRCOL_00002406-RA